MYNVLVSIRDNWLAFRERIEKAASVYGRDPSKIAIMAVSKTRSTREILEANACGLSLFGENRVEEACNKFPASEGPALYLIGHQQSRKVKKIDARFFGVHSIDSLGIARKLSRRAGENGTDLEILLQVNTSGEKTKFGFDDYAGFVETAAEIAGLPFLTLRGLMTMAPFTDNESVVRDCFSKCRRWSEDIADMIEGNTVLSMGMSSDFHWAIAEGSNLLRIGSAIFGGR